LGGGVGEGRELRSLPISTKTILSPETQLSLSCSQRAILGTSSCWHLELT
jgi:hypothetical protein